MFCSKCLTEYPTGSKECSSCGVALVDSLQDEDTGERRSEFEGVDLVVALKESRIGLDHLAGFVNADVARLRIAVMAGIFVFDEITVRSITRGLSLVLVKRRVGKAPAQTQHRGKAGVVQVFGKSARRAGN